VRTPAALRASAGHVFVESLERPVLDARDVHHLRRVLRVRDADVVSASDGAGRWCTGRLRGDVLDLDGPILAEPPSRTVTIATAVPKGDRSEWMVQKLTELGVRRILFVECTRSVVRWDGERAASQLDRLRRIAREAAMQSRQVWLPIIDGPQPFAAVIDGEGVAVADPDGCPPCAGPMWRTMVIGPEGGLTAEELGCGAPRLALSPHILRIETAAVAAAVLAGTSGRLGGE
jgi:16S rRNA (uracil1498-N3)-methyltransferase